MIQRLIKNEQLDDLNSSGSELHGALDSLRWINRWLGNKRAILKSIDSLNIDYNGNRLRIVDLACGGGDLSIAIAKHLRKKTTDFSIIGIDGNSNTVKFARKQSMGFPEIKFEVEDIFDENFKIPPCELLIVSQFIYRLPEEGILNFLDQNRYAVTIAILFSELERSFLSMVSLMFFGLFMPISKLAQEDGKLAIRRSYLKREWTSILSNCSMPFHISRYAFFRLVIILYPNRMSKTSKF